MVALPDLLVIDYFYKNHVKSHSCNRSVNILLRAYAFLQIVGANAGIGFELVKLLAEKNHIVYLAARNETAGKEAECV